jgi:hypothetical protein
MAILSSLQIPFVTLLPLGDLVVYVMSILCVYESYVLYLWLMLVLFDIVGAILMNVCFLFLCIICVYVCAW